MEKHEMTEKQNKYFPVKRAMDVVLSGGAIVILSPVLAGIVIAIKLDSKGPVLFKQKRVGKNKELFEIWKFRSMYAETPKDLPTHMLDNPDAYITKIGKFLRKTSLDELPQIFNIFKGQMSIIGPRPALWNQDDLIAERDKYGANDITPGLTGWAQINGRDELEIPVKARFDGEYVDKMGFWMDLKCFLGTIGSVLSSDGVVEGGTREMHKHGEDIDAAVSPEKLRKKIRTGAAVVGACSAITITALAALWKRLKGNEKKESKHTGWKIAGSLAAAVAARISAYAVHNKMNRVRWDKEGKSKQKSIKVSSFQSTEDAEATLPVEKKKILFLSNHFITLFSFRKELINRLVEEGHDIYISTPEDSDNKYFSDLGCKIIPTPMDRRGVNPKNDIKTVIAYRKIMRKVKLDIIFSYTIKPNIYGSLVSNILGYKQVCNVTGTGATFLEKNFVSEVAKTLYKVSLKHCYKVFFQNSGDRDYFVENHMVKDNWEMLPGSGVNLEKYTVKPFPTDDEICFIFIGRVMELKGIDQYMETAEVIRGKYPNTKFLIAGWNEEEKYKAKVKEYEEKGSVEYIGFQKNIGEWIEKCQCTILPSHGGEGVPNVLLETAASGRVCITSSINGSKDVVDNGNTGYIFETGSTESLVDKIEKFLALSNSDRARMGLAGRKKVEEEFDREIVIQRYMKIVHETEARL